MSSQDYHILDEVLADGDIPIAIYENKITGLKVVTGFTECPIVKGDLVFATEAHDDDGLPHTLEHLVFMGCESYPYKGVLDLIANRCLASGTNAYTDVDHTDFTMSTAGSAGFLQLLPIYLDHLLFPTLTDAAYTTEVHHINSDGEDAGIVYCEMQARENTGDSRCHLEMLRALYPGASGYKSETGGLLENLRTSTSNQKCRDYHKKFYHARNLCVIVTGPVKANDIFEAIKPIEDKIVQKAVHNLGFERPWQTPVEPMKESSQLKIQYSSDTDDDGLVYIGFRGPQVVQEYTDLVAISTLLDYLNSTSISPIQREFVECEEPLCSFISHHIIENLTSVFYLTFESVGKAYLDNVREKLFTILQNICDGKEELDMKRLHTTIERKKVRILSTAETSPHSIVTGPVIGHFLYGTGNLKERCQEIPILDSFLSLPDKFWIALIEKYMTGAEARYACVVGEPSPSLMQAMAAAEKERIKKQQSRLKDELPLIAEKLKSDISANEQPPPPEMISRIEVPSPDSIKFHPIERVVLDTAATPFRFHYDSIKTNFVTIHFVLDTSFIEDKTDRLYLPLLAEMLLELPIERDGQIVPYEQVVAELYSDTISNYVGLGLASSAFYATGMIGMLFDLSMQVEISKYQKAVQWYHELLYRTIFTVDRIRTIARRMASDISQYKRSGGKVLSAVSNGLTYQSNSNQWASNFMRQQKFLKALIANLDRNPDDVVQNLTRIRDAMTRPNNVFVHISLNKSKIDVEKVHEPWLAIVPDEIINNCPKSHIDIKKITPDCKLVEMIEQPKAAIVGVGSVESNYMQQLVRSIDSPKHPDVAALFVLIEYLTQLEGPMWRQIRGLGLSYNYSLQLSPSDGLLYFLLYKSSQLVAAYAKALEIVDLHLDGHEEFDQNLFESAKSCLIFEFIKREKSAAGKSMQSLVAYLRDLDINFNRDLIKQVANVTVEDLRRVGPKYLKPLFYGEDTRSVVCCNPSKMEDITKGLADTHKFVIVNLETEPFINDYAR